MLDIFGANIDDETLSQLVGGAYEYGQGEHNFADGHQLSSDPPHVIDGFPAHLLSAARRNAVWRYKFKEPSLMQQVLAELGEGVEGHNMDLGGE